MTQQYRSPRPRARRQAPCAPFNERRLARRWLLHQMKIARVRGDTTIRVSVRVLEALRPALVTSLGDSEGRESAA